MVFISLVLFSATFSDRIIATFPFILESMQQNESKAVDDFKA